MEIKKNHNKYQIYYRCPNFPKTIYESFDSYEEANLRAAQIELDKKNGTLRPNTSRPIKRNGAVRP